MAEKKYDVGLTSNIPFVDIEYKGYNHKTVVNPFYAATYIGPAADCVVTINTAPVKGVAYVQADNTVAYYSDGNDNTYVDSLGITVVDTANNTGSMVANIQKKPQSAFFFSYTPQINSTPLQVDIPLNTTVVVVTMPTDISTKTFATLTDIPSPDPLVTITDSDTTLSITNNGQFPPGQINTVTFSVRLVNADTSDGGKVICIVQSNPVP